MSNEELLKKLDRFTDKLDNVDKVIKAQDIEIKKLRRILQEIYKDNYQKKMTIDKYEEKCGKEVNNDSK